MSKDLETALAAIRVEESDPYRADDEFVPDHAPDLLADLRALATRQGRGE